MPNTWKILGLTFFLASVIPMACVGFVAHIIYGGFSVGWDTAKVAMISVANGAKK